MRHTRSEVLGHAIRTAVRNPGRSILTMLGLAIGVGAFIAMVSFGTGARRSVLEQFEVLGTRVIRVRSNVGRTDVSEGGAQPLTNTEVAALLRDGTAFSRVVPAVTQVHSVTNATASHFTSVTGTTPELTAVNDWPTLIGGMFDDVDLQQRAKVAVLGATVARKLFGSADPLGQSVNIGSNLPCQIIGVLAEKGQSTSGRDLDDTVLVPASTFQAFLGMPNGFTDIHVQVQSPGMLNTAIAEATRIIRQSHRLSEGDANDFRIGSPVQAQRAAEDVAGILTALLAGIAAVSLLVGGIGVMNIQLVSVAERTKEIGVRSAIGASPQQILKQFLSEAFVLSFTGSLAGVVLGWLLATVVAQGMGWAEGVSLATILGSGAFGTLVGMGFGYLPAQRAAQLEPIDALRHE